MKQDATYKNIIKWHASYARSDWTSFIFPQSTETLWRHFHFVLEYRDMGDVMKSRKNLGYFIKQIKNSFRVSVQS